MKLGIQVDVDGPLRAFKELREDQIPFTIARALTKTAMDARDAGRAEEGRVFTLRNDWTQQRTLVEIATKQNLTAAVYTDTQNRKTGAPDYMPAQEEGITKTPNSFSFQYNGQGWIAAPTKYMRRIYPGVIPVAMRPSRILPFADVGALTKNQTRQRRRSARGGMYYFVVTLHSGKFGIMCRQANDPKDAAVLLYTLMRSASRKGGERVTQKILEVAGERFELNFSRAATEIRVNDALRGSGVRVAL